MLLPEIFLKAVSVVRNLGVRLEPITTANFDFVQHYRPLQNVVKRPTAHRTRETGQNRRGSPLPATMNFSFLWSLSSCGGLAKGETQKMMNPSDRIFRATRV